jgi:hypothetical protein
MDYKSIYESLINKARVRLLTSGPNERHHVIPRCLGGSNEKINLVWLTLGEHFTAHLLLAKIHGKGSKLWYAANKMANFDRYCTNKKYEWLRGRCRPWKQLKLPFTQNKESWIMSMKGKKRSSETLNKQSKTSKAVMSSPEMKIKMSLIRKGKKHGPHKIQICPHCLRQLRSKAHHFDNCKMRNH